MKKIAIMAAAFLVLAGLFVNESYTCTTFCLVKNGEVLFGKNYDWNIGDGAVFVNKRGVSKYSAVDSEKNIARWTSKYGSVTFNQYGRESPSGGMNEAGLVIELMWLDDTQYPAADDRPAIDVLEWIQFNLDTAATTDEVLKNAETVRISSPVKLHYLVNDRSGRSATVEFLDGMLTSHTGDALPIPALTNDTFDRSHEYTANVAVDGVPGEGSLERFSRAYGKAYQFNRVKRTEQESVKYAFDILSNVAQKNSTQWSIVYDQKRGKIYFRTRRSPAIKVISSDAFDYSCSTAVKMLDMNTPGSSGNVTSGFKDYTRKANRDLIERSFRGTDFLRDIPAADLDAHAEYPERFPCSAGAVAAVGNVPAPVAGDNFLSTAVSAIVVFYGHTL